MVYLFSKFRENLPIIFELPCNRHTDKERNGAEHITPAKSGGGNYWKDQCSFS